MGNVLTSPIRGVPLVLANSYGSSPSIPCYQRRHSRFVRHITVFYRTSTFMFVLSLALVTLCYYYKQIKRPQENFWPALARCSSSYCCATVKIFVDSINYDTIHCPTGKFSMTPSWTPRYHCDDIINKSSVPLRFHSSTIAQLENFQPRTENLSVQIGLYGMHVDFSQ